MKATIISDKVVVHIAFCLSAGKYKCLLVPELRSSGVWDAACRARCCDTPAPSPASRGGAPGRMRRWPTHNRENLHLQDKFTGEVVMI